MDSINLVDLEREARIDRTFSGEIVLRLVAVVRAMRDDGEWVQNKLCDSILTEHGIVDHEEIAT